jgi:hypothetical protein
MATEQPRRTARQKREAAQRLAARADSPRDLSAYDPSTWTPEAREETGQ